MCGGSVVVGCLRVWKPEARHTPERGVSKSGCTDKANKCLRVVAAQGCHGKHTHTSCEGVGENSASANCTFVGSGLVWQDLRQFSKYLCNTYLNVCKFQVLECWN